MTQHHERIVEENLGLVGHMIARVFGPNPRLGAMDYDDLFQIGSIGLCKAAETYRDIGRAKFSTYACVVIRNELHKAIENETQPETLPLDERIPASDRQDGDDVFQYIKSLMEDATPAEKRNLQALLHFAEGYSCKEIGGILGISDRHAAALISRARGMVRRDIETHTLHAEDDHPSINLYPFQLTASA